jgi:quercetin dioxygenase-like cupin family protein
MKIKRALFFMIWILPLPLAAQAPAPITMDDEPHHHLALKNDVVKVFEVELQPRDSFLMHSHDTDDVSIVIGDSATVNVSPGKADVLSMSKDAEVRYSLSGRVHLVRNIGQTPYRFVAIDLLRAQTGARNLCGKQISGGLHASPEAFSVKVEPAPVLNRPQNCPAAPAPGADAPRVDQPQYETDQTRVTVTRIRPRQSATLGDSDRDDLIVTIDESAVAAAAGKGPDKALHPGDFVWIGHGEAARIFKNTSEKEIRVVTVALKP